MNTLKDIIILVFTLIISGFFSQYLGNIYESLFPSSGSITSVDLTSLAGFPLAYEFFLPLLFTAFGGAKKYWWIGVLLLPAVAFEVYFDLSHIYFPVILGLIGWALGLLAFKLLLKINKSHATDKTVH